MRRTLPALLAGVFAAAAVTYLGWSLWRIYENPTFTGWSIADSPPDNLETPVMAPEPISGDQATRLDDDDLVVGVVRGGKARAYSIRYLDEREHVNDSLGGTPVCVTW